MIFSLMYIAVGIGKFADEFLPLPRWQAALAFFAVVGIYVTLRIEKSGRFFEVNLLEENEPATPLTKKAKKYPPG